MSGVHVALIGSGRWGRVHASVLAGMAPRIERVTWVVRRNDPALDTFATFGASAPRLKVLDSLEAALRERPEAAIVATTSTDHAATAEMLLRSGVHALVEKPLALSVASAQRLVALAGQHARVLCVGLHLLKAEFLQRFRHLCSGRSIASLEVEWFDPSFETRYGETKSCNFSAHKADDAVPHIWSILAALLPGYPMLLRAARAQPLGAVELEVGVGPTCAVARVARRSRERRRRITLKFSDGGSGVLDFNEMPAKITIDGLVRERSEPAGDIPGPLAAEIAAFLDAVADPKEAQANPQMAQRCLGSVELAVAVREALADQEARATADALASGIPIEDPNVSAWIIDNVAPLLGYGGTRVMATDGPAQARIIDAARQVLTDTGSDHPGSDNTGSGLDDLVAPLRQESAFLKLVAQHLSERQFSGRRHYGALQRAQGEE